jgi:pimeloyl-ACP methyl ester carboxylesterase
VPAVPGPVIKVPDHELAELRSRLRATRWPAPYPGTAPGDWDAGTDASELRRLVSYWASGYDWRRHEAAINALPWAVADLDGIDQPVYYLRFNAEQFDTGQFDTGHGENLPLVLTNGWPSSFLELVGLARRLSAPSRWGGDPADAFTVIVPCLPGFPVSPQPAALPGPVPTHELWHRLMHDELGLARYGAYGGDLGAGTTSLLAQAHPDAVAGIHLMSVADPPAYDRATLTAAERDYLDQVAGWFAADGAYEHQQMTRPVTLSYGLSDSPAGLLAWMLEKYEAWSDHGGDLSSVYSPDDILTQASLYWHTNCIGTSFRPYYEYARGLTERVRRVEVPTAVAVFPKDLSRPPRSWAERTYRVVRYTEMPRGGHFAPHEQPALLATDLAAFFGPLRLAGQPGQLGRVAEMPPSTSMVAPCIIDASSEATKATVAATSSGRTGAPAGVPAVSCSITSLDASLPGVSVAPGATVLTRTLLGPNSPLDPEQRLVVYTTEPDSPTARALPLLASYGADTGQGADTGYGASIGSGASNRAVTTD